MTHMVLVFEGITLTLAWLLANDELYSYTYLYVYIYINILYTQLYIYIFLCLIGSIHLKKKPELPPKKHTPWKLKPLWFSVVVSSSSNHGGQVSL